MPERVSDSSLSVTLRSFVPDTSASVKRKVPVASVRATATSIPSRRRVTSALGAALPNESLSVPVSSARNSGAMGAASDLAAGTTRALPVNWPS